MNSELSRTRLEFLANLPSILNSSLQISLIVEQTMQHLKAQLSAEAATIFLLDASGKQLSFWVLEGGSNQKLAGKKMPADVGIVGWVIANQQSVLVPDAKSDPRFFSKVDNESGFQTRSVMCTPLTIRGTQKIGAIQVLNRVDDSEFQNSDLLFLEQVAHQVALAIGNAQLFQEFQELNQQLVTINRRKDDILAVINHEFRTPLNLIQNSVELLASDILDAQMKSDIKRTLVDGLRRLTQVVAKVRDVSQLTSSSLIVKTTPTSLSEVFQTLDKDFSEICRNRKLNWECQLPEPSVKVSADMTLLLVAMKNLLANSVRFTPDLGTVRLLSSTSTGLCEISIQDTGIGIDPSQLSAIFEKFYGVGDVTLHSSGTYEFRSGGLGLGLPTARTILSAHGASLNVKSTLNGGSTFSFALKVLE